MKLRNNLYVAHQDAVSMTVKTVIVTYRLYFNIRHLNQPHDFL